MMILATFACSFLIGFSCVMVTASVPEYLVLIFAKMY